MRDYVDMTRYESLNRNPEPQFSRTDEYEDTPFHHLLLRLPEELVERHMDLVEEQGLDDTEITTYLETLLAGREKAMTESLISDESLLEFCDDVRADLINRLGNEVFNQPDIGAGQTAKIKKVNLSKGDQSLDLAIKYIVTPTKKP